MGEAAPRIELHPSDLKQLMRNRRFSKICADEIAATLQINSSQAEDELYGGTIVDATSIGKSAKRGRIREANNDDTFYVVYDDGEHDRMVQRHNIEMVGSTRKRLLVLGQEQKVEIGDIHRTKTSIMRLQEEHERQSKLRESSMSKTLYPHEAQKAMALGEATMGVDTAPWIRAFIRDQHKQLQHKEELQLIAKDVKELKASDSLFNGS
jgi:hypothetical protein